MAKELACRKCKIIIPSSGRVCPSCGGTDLSTDWSGLVVLSNPDKSQVAKQLNFTKPGRYAIKVS
ncbi:MAG: DNA-directed RNA polymerase, subunit E'' [Thaumarchaeota archaeon]|jgi:DNA-directed RNA polymerase subunit E"|nr:DNA-directed RNA polymerase, subunit E'' [Nitrososphaerales archaeon]NSL73399.1 DNA-directed RNA polymerase, subunit E'' [Nitrososphaerota archaeon]NSL74623.1 DNA-directed RNA polymerase, subunit E'' [Nitrososphaerota archaeon]NSL75118.1 DNA-directed RNA polymerase, subunit E'' [Nitrososphaerota archaeon]NSL77428.1 DNA-directed RNA polymerase, subunit E'' [Nitrososphaerota archaeon]